MPEQDRVLIVNLDTGEVMDVDHYMLVELSMPKGFTLVDDVKPLEWATLVRKLHDRVVWLEDQVADVAQPDNKRNSGYGASSGADWDAE
jgi:hypothetical protein